MKITQIKTITKSMAPDLDFAVNDFLAKIEGDVLDIKFVSDDTWYIAHIIYIKE
nr:MAG TPA: Sporulation protein Cse60 [Caudoviricetes sp.]